MTTKMSETTPTGPTWAILDKILHVNPNPTAPDSTFYLTSPPQVSMVSVAHHISPVPPTMKNLPFILATSDGLLLFHATQGPPPGPLHVINKSTGDEYFSHRVHTKAYFLADLSKPGSALRLPESKFPLEILHPLNVGLVTSADGDTGVVSQYMVAELQLILNSDRADLMCFSSEAGKWVRKELRNPLPFRFWRNDGVVSCYNRLWWIDLSWGVLTCDPYDESPDLRFVELPEGSVVKRFHCEGGELDKERFVGVSDGRLRYVEVSHVAATVTMWTLPTSESPEWTREFRVPFAAIWADESYVASGLPTEVPVPAFVHPFDALVVYFLFDGRLFGVNVRTKKIQGCCQYTTPSGRLSSWYLLPCLLPPGLGLSNEPVPTRVPIPKKSTNSDDESSSGHEHDEECILHSGSGQQCAPCCKSTAKELRKMARKRAEAAQKKVVVMEIE